MAGITLTPFSNSHRTSLLGRTHNRKHSAPRIGAAYQLRDKVVLRGGYGVFYVPDYYGQGPNTGYSQPTPWVTSLNGGLNPSSTLSGNASLGLPSAFPNGQIPVTGNS